MWSEGCLLSQTTVVRSSKQASIFVLTNNFGWSGLLINIISYFMYSVAPPEKLNSEILKFIGNVKENFLDTLTEKDVNTFARTLLLKKTDPDKRLASEATRNWNEIATGRLQFDRRQKEAEALLNVRKDDILNYWNDNILGASGGRRMLISEVVPKSGAASSKVPAKSYDGGRQLGINNVDSYRKDRETEL